jgi:hypothetical protein
MSNKNLLCRHVLFSKLTGEQHANIACSTIKEVQGTSLVLIEQSKQSLDSTIKEVPCTSLIEQPLTQSKVLQSKPLVLIEHYTCKFGESCRGAHSEKDIILYSGNKHFNELDKSTYNFSLLFEKIKETIISEKYKVKLEKHVNIIDNIDKLNNIELLQLWRELACYYRKISKTDKAIPQFDLKEHEDIAWAFERKTKLCKTFLEENKKEKIHINKDKICCGSYNCKEGVHSINELICIDDFIGIDCNCPSKIDLEKCAIELLEQYNMKARELLQNPNYSIKINLKKELDIMNIEINNTRNRKEHFTEYGMIPIKVNPIETIIEDKKPIAIKKLTLGKK